MLVWASYSNHAADGDQSRLEGKPTLVGSGRYFEPSFEVAPPPVRYDHRDVRRTTRIGTPVIRKPGTWRKP